MQSQTVSIPKTIKQKTSMMALIICGLGALFYCYEYFLRISPSVMATELMQSYHITATQLGNLVAFYYYAYMPMQIIVGIFMDRYGPRLLVTIACLMCAIGTYLFACSDVLAIAQIGRFMVGFGSAFAFVGALKLATIWLPMRRFALFSGIIVALGNVGAMVGDVALTTMVQHQTWRQACMMSAALGIVLAIFIVMIVRDRNSSVPKEFQQDHINESFGHVLSGLWQALKRRQIWFNGLIAGLTYIPTTAFAELWGIPYLKQARGFTSHEAAITVSMIFLGWVIGCPLVGFISDHINRRVLPMMVGAAVALVISCIILYSGAMPVHVTMVLFFLLGLFACVQVLVFAYGRESSPRNIAGTAIALTNAFAMVGGVIFQPVIGMLLDKRWAGDVLDGVRVYDTASFQYALSVIPIGLAVSIVIMFMMRETRCHVAED